MCLLFVYKNHDVSNMLYIDLGEKFLLVLLSLIDSLEGRLTFLHVKVYMF